jgi:hypothetical protein
VATAAAQPGSGGEASGIGHHRQSGNAPIASSCRGSVVPFRRRSPLHVAQLVFTQ